MTQFGILHKVARLYTFHSPIQKGKFRISDLAINLSKKLTGEVVVDTLDGRKLIIDTANESYRFIYFLGEYEANISRILTKLVEPGATCLDIGGNIGWYTTMFQKLVGKSGKVHSFEPVPPIFETLKQNVALNEFAENVKINNLALGDEEGTVDLHIFPELPHGHASISTFDHKEFISYSSKIITLDSYLETNSVGNVDLVKIDIEGAELMMLKGASKLFKQSKPPVFEIEMALATSRGFGYVPNDLIEYIRSQADYDFYAIDERYPRLTKIDGFAPDDIGANVLCVPNGFEMQKLAAWLS